MIFLLNLLSVFSGLVGEGTQSKLNFKLERVERARARLSKVIFAYGNVRDRPFYIGVYRGFFLLQRERERATFFQSMMYTLCRIYYTPSYRGIELQYLQSQIFQIYWPIIPVNIIRASVASNPGRDELWKFSSSRHYCARLRGTQFA